MSSYLILPQLQNCRRIFLRNYEVSVGIGVHQHEKRKKQRLLINIDLYVPLSESQPLHDQLDEVVDYDFMRISVAQRIAEGHIQLQETLCDELAADMLAHGKVRAVRVSTMKPDVYPDCEGVGVEVFRIKELA